MFIYHENDSQILNLLEIFMLIQIPLDVSIMRSFYLIKSQTILPFLRYP